MRPWTEQKSRYLRTTWLFAAETHLWIPEIDAAIRPFSGREASQLKADVRKRNIFARHSWENNFYLQRIDDIAGHTIIEVFRPGDPDSVIEDAMATADAIERAAVACSTLAGSREAHQRRLAIAEHRQEVFDLTVGPNIKYMRSKWKKKPAPTGLIIDAPFARRWNKQGLVHVVRAQRQGGGIADRLRASLRWLMESRLEGSSRAALVKSAVALEALLVGSPNEPLRSSLSERSAFLLSEDPGIRSSVAGAVKQFYDVRSRIVHGDRGTAVAAAPRMLEGADRLLVLLALVLAANERTWRKFDRVLEWCVGHRWGERSARIERPFGHGYLTRALARF